MTDTAAPPANRRGGREARRALRAAPLANEIRPVNPGMESGRYKVLTDAEVVRVHEAALDVLEHIGLADAIPSCVELLTAKGCWISPEGRLCFPRSLIDETLAMAGRHFPLYGQDPRHDMEPWGKKVYYGTAGAAVYVVDPVTGEYRESQAQDCYDIARLVDTMEHIHFYQRTVVPRDLPDPEEMDINTCYLSVSGTTKHVGTSWVHPTHLEKSLQMLHHIAGGEKQWRERPFVSQSNCFVVPPLKFAADACRCLEVAVRGGMPVLLLSAGQAGATAPAALAGALVQEVAEVLAGLAYVNAIVPGHPAIFGLWPFVSDLRSGAMSGGSPEQALLSSACAQMAHYYDLTGGTSSGIADAKMPDYQSGAEKGYNHALVGNAGANLIYEAAGMHGSLLGFSLEGVVLDNDTIGACQRTIRGIDVNDETLSVDVMREAVVGGPGHYLGSKQTLEIMQTEYIYPAICDRLSPKEWAEVGRPKVLDRAAAKVRDVLATHFPDHVSDEIDDRIRAELPIRLDRSLMRPSN
ncbi:MAG: trimethylamine methyltransferase family protein [Ilumatobacteraceae bacterium]